MYVELGYNISIVFLLSFGLNKAAYIFGVKNSKNDKFSTSLFVDLGIMIGLNFFFADQSVNMKASIYTIFLAMLYIKTINPFLSGPLQKLTFILAEGTLYSLFLILALKI